MLAERGLVFPPINEILRWQDIFPTFNKIALIACLAALIGIGLFLAASRRDPMVAPTGPRNLAESTIEFIEEGIVMQTIGKEGLKWTPFLLSLFVFIFLCNIPGILPVFQMPATARIAIPLALSLLVWVVYIGVGLKHQGLGYFGHLLWPPGVPTALKPLVGVIEFISTIFVRPFSLAVRLFANLVAGHTMLALLLGTAGVFWIGFLSGELEWTKALTGTAWFVLGLGIYVFEILVAILQAYIFTLLSAVYIQTSLHPEH